MYTEAAAILQKGRMPEGFTAILSQTVVTTAAQGIFSFKLEDDYWFFLEAVVGKWTAPGVASVPSLEIFRAAGDRSLVATPVDFRLVGTPGEAPSQVAQLGRVVGLGMYFPPGSALQMRLTGYVPNDPAAVVLAAWGRYVLDPEGGVNGK